MQDTLTIVCSATTAQTTTIPLPYYAMKDKKYYAITGETDNLTVRFFETISPLISSEDARFLPADAERISQSVFIEAYVKARAALNKKFLSACPSINTAQSAA